MRIVNNSSLVAGVSFQVCPGRTSKRSQDVRSKDLWTYVQKVYARTSWERLDVRPKEV